VSKFLKQKLSAEAAIEAARKALEEAQADAKRQIEEAAKVRRVEIAALVERAGGLELSDGLILAAIANLVDASDAVKKKLEAEAEARFPSRRRSKSGSKGASSRTTGAGADAADADEDDLESGADSEEDDGDDADDRPADTGGYASAGMAGSRF
jgi:hypothetical protein